MKRRHFFIGFMLIIVLAGVLFVSNSISANFPTLAEIETLPLIIVDPGHGDAINTIYHHIISYYDTKFKNINMMRGVNIKL